jgi:hypothetical protein
VMALIAGCERLPRDHLFSVMMCCLLLGLPHSSPTCTRLPSQRCTRFPVICWRRTTGKQLRIGSANYFFLFQFQWESFNSCLFAGSVKHKNITAWCTPAGGIKIEGEHDL